VEADKPKYLIDDINRGLSNLPASLKKAALQTLNTTGALSGEAVRAMKGKGFNVRNILPEYLFGTGKQASVSEELDIQNPLGRVVIDAGTDPLGTLTGARVATSAAKLLSLPGKANRFNRFSESTKLLTSAKDHVKKSITPAAAVSGLTNEITNDKYQNGGKVNRMRTLDDIVTSYQKNG